MEQDLTNYFAFHAEMERRRGLVENFSEVSVDYTTPGFDKKKLIALTALRAVPELVVIDIAEDHSEAA